MGFIFDHESADRLETWYRSEIGRTTFRLQKDMTLRLLKPQPGERLLDVGCGAGWYLQVFTREGLRVTGLDPSPEMLDLARKRLGRLAELVPGQAEDLPFSDNEFDVVTMITTLEFVNNPRAAIAEAVRVAQRRVYIGVLNSLSMTGLGRRLRGLVSKNFYNRARFFSLWEILRLLKMATGSDKALWGSVGLFPQVATPSLSAFEAKPIVQRSPWGAFLGVAADVTYQLRTDNLIVQPGSFQPQAFLRPGLTAGLPQHGLKRHRRETAGPSAGGT